MYIIELTRTFVAVKFAKMSFVFLLILMSCAFSFYFFSQAAHSQLSQFMPSGINSNATWYTLGINNKYGLKGDGLYKIKAEKLIESSQDIIKDWFVTLDNGKSHINLMNKSYEVSPELYFNDAPSLLDIELFKGKLPNKNKKEILISYDFWQNQLTSLPDVTNNYIEINDSKFLISGITQQGFNSFFLNDKFDIFVDANQWMVSQNKSPSFWQIILLAKPINLGFTVKNNLSHENIFSKLKIVAQNLHIDNSSSSTVIFKGLVSDTNSIQAFVEFSQFYFFIALSIVILAFLAFVLYQSMHIIQLKNELGTRSILGENDYYIFINQFIYVFFWLMVSMMLGLLLFHACLFSFKESSLIKFLYNKTVISNLIPPITSIVISSLIVASVLGYLAIVVIEQKVKIIKKMFILLISSAMIIMFGLTAIAWINKIELQNKFGDKVSFQTDNIYQWIYTNKSPDFIEPLNKTNISNTQTELKNILKKNLHKYKGIEDILVSNITPINGYNMNGTIKYEDDGNLSIKNHYFANVNAAYFNFFKIPIVSGKIPKHAGESEIIINTTLARKYGGTLQSIGKVTGDGERIVAVIKDAHFLNGNMTAPPFKYYINNKSQDYIILIKGKFDVSYVYSVIKNVMKEYHSQYTLLSSNSFKNEYRSFFTQEINRLMLLSLIATIIFIIGLFSLYSGSLQWIEISKKNIAIRFALGLTENRLWKKLSLKTFYWLLIISIVTYLMLIFIIPNNILNSGMITLLTVLSAILLLVTFSIVIIYWFVLKRFNNDFLSKVL